MLRTIVPTLTFLLGLGMGIVATYGPTREKWHDLGHDSGLIQGRAEVMRGLCTFGLPGQPANAPDYSLDVKADRMEVYRDADGGLRLYCR